VHFTVQYCRPWIAFSHKPYSLSLCATLIYSPPVLVSMETVVNVEGATWQDTTADISQHALVLMEENRMMGFACACEAVHWWWL